MSASTLAVPYPRVAVCLAAHDGVAWLDEQVDSILAQQDVAIVLHVGVDVSTDGTEAWFDRRAATDARICLLPHGHHANGAAGNFFRLLRDVDFSTCDYVAFADQDDLWHADKLCRAIRVMTEKDAVAYSSDVVAFWPDGREALVRKSQAQRSWDYLFEAAGPGCTYVMRRGLVLTMQAALRADPAATAGIRFHDWYIYAFARTHGLPWYIDNRPSLHYRQHQSNVLGSRHGWYAIMRRARMLVRGEHLDQARRIARACGTDRLCFVRRTLLGGRAGLLRLALHAGACRRKYGDRIIFALACLWLALRGE